MCGDRNASLSIDSSVTFVARLSDIRDMLMVTLHSRPTSLGSPFRASLLGAAFLLSGSVASLASEPTAAGLWQKTEDNKPVVWVLVKEQGGVYEGSIAKLFPAPGEDANETCVKCTDDRRGQPILGITFIREMKRAGLKYEEGRILDPRDGKIYKAMMSVSPDGKSLTVRGYWGIALLGKDETWTRLPDAAIATLEQPVKDKLLPELAAAMKPQVAPTKKSGVATPARQQAAQPLAPPPNTAPTTSTTGKRSSTGGTAGKAPAQPADANAMSR